MKASEKQDSQEDEKALVNETFVAKGELAT